MKASTTPMSSIQANKRWELSKKKKKENVLAAYKKRIKLAVCENGKLSPFGKKSSGRGKYPDLYSDSLDALL